MFSGTPPPRTDDSERNRLLLALTPGEYTSLALDLEMIDWPVRTILHEPAAVISHAYFPQHGVASLIAVDRAGSGVEVVSIGREGMVGMALFHGAESSPQRCLVQIAGSAKRITAAALARHLPQLPGLQRLLHRNADAAFNDAAQTVTCNRHHSFLERTARWLLMTDDCVGGETFVLTHEFLAYMLASRRSSVSVAASQLQRDGLIQYSRGTIRIRDRVGLEAAACECYDIGRASHERVFA
jgi:CRP-like cAMP-binding protein